MGPELQLVPIHPPGEQRNYNEIHIKHIQRPQTGQAPTTTPLSGLHALTNEVVQQEGSTQRARCSVHGEAGPQRYITQHYEAVTFILDRKRSGRETGEKTSSTVSYRFEKSNLDSGVKLMGMFLDCGRKSNL